MNQEEKRILIKHLNGSFLPQQAIQYLPPRKAHGIIIPENLGVYAYIWFPRLSGPTSPKAKTTKPHPSQAASLLTLSQQQGIMASYFCIFILDKWRKH